MKHSHNLSPSTFFVLSASHKTADLAVREKFSIPNDLLPLLSQDLFKLDGLNELVVLNTCNRVEFYGAALPSFNPESLLNTYCQHISLDPSLFKKHSLFLQNQEAIHHLFQVASGLHSQMIGETEILGQTKDAFASAEENKFLGPLTHRIFQKSFQAAKWIRTHTHVGHGQISIGSVAAELASRIFGSLNSVRILLVGIGEAGEKTAEALKIRGADNLTVTNRTFQKADHLATKIGGMAIHYELFPKMLGNFDIIISCTASPDLILSKELTQKALHGRNTLPLFLIDLSVPRNICATTAHLENTYLYNLDDLATIANENLKARQKEVEKCESLLKEKSTHLWHHINNKSPLPSASKTDSPQESPNPGTL